MAKPLLQFTQALWAGGDLVLTTYDAPEADDLMASLCELQRLEREYRCGLPGEPPVLSPASAEWALRSLYRAGQFLVYRELPEELLRTELGVPCPEAPGPEVCYSVDLSFRFLPEILRFARAANIHDPLVRCLTNWAGQWPLSSVGILNVQPQLVEPFLNDPSLRALYVDRVLATQDVSRLANPATKEAIRVALGDFRELSPALYDAAHVSV